MPNQSRLRPLFALVLILAALLIANLGDVRAATFRTWVAQVPAVPNPGEPVRVWMNSDTVPGETAGVEYVANNNYFKILGVFDNVGYAGANWRVDIPAQLAGTSVRYQLFTRNQGGSDYGFTGFSWSYKVKSAKALWLDGNTIAWNGAAGSSYRLLYDADGGVAIGTVTSVCNFSSFASPCYVPLAEDGLVNGYPKNPNANGLKRLLTNLSNDNAKSLLNGQTVVVSYDGAGEVLEHSATQSQSVLDWLYAVNAKQQALGVTYPSGIPSVKLWAPTAKKVTLRRYADSSTTAFTAHPMALDADSGVWSLTGESTWNRQYYLFEVEVYVPSADEVVKNLVSDPYAISLSQDAQDANDVRSQFVNLADADLKPAGWDNLTKPSLAAFEDISIYEMHIRDFSINDSTLDAADLGTYNAFTYDGAGPDPNATLSDGMKHLLTLKDAGLTHVHLLPTFDIASVIETTVPRTVSPNPTGYARDGEQQQYAIAASRATDGFNWGYDPYHYGAVEGSYSSDPNGAARILQFRRMVSALNRNGLRVIMDVVYNHTAASGQNDYSVLDKIVPGYYYRYDAAGNLYQTSCCADTASEYDMMEKLMIDTVLRFARDYKVDGFRFDLMNFHTRRNMENIKSAVQALQSNGVDGGKIYLYGEGWDFGSAKDKGLTSCTEGWCYAGKFNMTGSGLGAFNDIIRDATHGGYSSEDLSIRKQGFINGLSYDWNGYYYDGRDRNSLIAATDTLRSGLRASGVDWNGKGSPFTDDPQESIPYIEKHDNETLFDQNVFKLPVSTVISDRVRAQNVGQSIITLAQGVPFFQMGTDILRSKSLDRNSYDSGDWFNRVDWTYTTNYFGSGLPPEWDNKSRWDIMTPLLNNTGLDPQPANIRAAAAHFREMLRVRYSSPLFRLRTEADVNTRVSFYNTDNFKDAFIIMRLTDEGSADLDANYENILVFFNANKMQQTYAISGANGFILHAVQSDGIDADPVVQGATFDDGTDLFTIPARTTAVFVSTQALTPPAPPSTLDWVGRLYPRGGVANQVDQGAFTPAGLDVFVRVYEAGMTEATGGNTGIACYLHWGKYGEAWNDVVMTFNAQFGNDDEYKGTIPQSTINGWTPGTYGFTAYCKKTGETSIFWKSDTYDINGNTADDDQGEGLITVIPTADPAPVPAGGVMVHLFEWRWADIEKECAYLAQKGYTAVQVSPPNEHLVPTADQGGPAANDYPWWARYQPVTHDTAKFTSRSGTWTEFTNMVSTCNSNGMAIYVDAVINHMADIEVDSPPTGTSGTQYDANPAATRYYGTQYQADDFHSDCTIFSYSDRNQVQRCKLSGLPDLNTGKTEVQTEIRKYLQALINVGVKGFRIDGAKHMAAQDIAAILNGLSGTFYAFGEVIDQSGNEPIRDWEYTPYGDVTEFAYPFFLGDKFDDACGGSLSQLENFENQTPPNSMLPSRFALVFTDNHDNQRGHGVGSGCVLDHRDGQEHVLANLFALAYPYGYPSIMSSYYWQSSSTNNAGDSMGPPTVNGGPGSSGATLPVYVDADNTPDNCAASYSWGKWACEHRRTGVANMVRFRQVTAGEAVTNWQNMSGPSSDHIAFDRGVKGFVAINGTAVGATAAYRTNLPTGTYCNIAKYDFDAATGKCLYPGTQNVAPSTDNIIVSAPPGSLTAPLAPTALNQVAGPTLAPMEAIAIHVNAKIGQPLAVELAALTAESSGKSIIVRWETVSEQDNAGFNVYRSTSQLGPWARANTALIPAAVPGSMGGHNYAWTDPSSETGGLYWYLLEDVALSGATTRHGPVAVALVAPNAVTLNVFEGRTATLPLALTIGLMTAVLAALVARRKGAV